MRHVREEVPDVQRSRPEVSSALAAIVDRATAKNLNKRYPDAATMLRDLEEALAIETARSGQATGEATTVIRTLRGSARRRLPLRMRNPGQIIAWLVAVALLVAGALYLAARNTHRGTSAPANVHAPALTKQVHVCQTCAHDYDPLGDHHRAPQRGQARRRRRPQHLLDDRDLSERQPRQAGRRRLRRRRAAGEGHQARDPDPDPGLRRPDLRGERGAPGHTSRPRLEARRQCERRQRRRADLSTPPASRSATTSSGSPSSRRARTAPRSRS